MAMMQPQRFQSTLPCGSDSNFISSSLKGWYFNPRSLAGATLRFKLKAGVTIFQSTLPCGSDRCKLHLCTVPPKISIHAPLRERLECGVLQVPTSYFNPRSLAGATIISRMQASTYRNFNPRSLAGATPIGSVISLSPVFQSTLPCGSDRVRTTTTVITHISIHAPLRERLGLFK